MIVVFGIVIATSFDRRRYFAPVFFVSLLFVALYDMREQINLYKARQNYSDVYTNVPILEQKNWFGIGYYPDILEKAQGYLNAPSNGQKVYLAVTQSFPFFGYSQYHLHPAETILIENKNDISSAKK